jgi:DNA-binding transcriptional ArsR family regulator
MSKVTLAIEDFKALASETRLDILRAIDLKTMSLKDISQATHLHETTVHEHLTKLVKSGFVKKNEREGHKWVYYTLSWKGSCLLHPDNTKVVVMFTSTIAVLLGGIFGLVTLLKSIAFPVMETTSKDGRLTAGASDGALIWFITIFFLVFFCICMVISLRMYQGNKPPKL